ncbi:MAG: D-glycero-beta-D-manno-heptose 1-phosphate adenylyltransferase [Acidiferrobacterales bacterium]
MTPSERKIVHDPNELPARLATLPRPFVFTNGCFDILHRGHISYLEDAARLGASLIVGVNSDASVRNLNKGPGRPINPLEDRMALLAALTCVALVVPFDEETPLELIKVIKPEHLVKGGDWAPENIVGAEFLKTYGGRTHAIPIRHERSTTELIDRIRRYE